MDSDVTSGLPRYKLGYHEDENARKMIESFLVEYYNHYDAPDSEQERKKLMNAYDENATFTYAIHILQDNLFVPRGDGEIYTSYLQSSHNIMTEPKWSGKRSRNVYKGSMDIAVALTKLPPTHHIKDSFILDLNLTMSNFVVCTLQGVFKDGRNQAMISNSDCFKYFLRNLMISVKGDGRMAIMSDILLITPIAVSRLSRFNALLKKARETQAIAPIGSIAITAKQEFVPELSIAPPSTPQPVLPPLLQLKSEAEKRDQMIRQLCEYSNMKTEWASKCLEDCSWDYDKALDTFVTVRSKIPADAFA